MTEKITASAVSGDLDQQRGYKSPAAALGDLLGWEPFEARRRVVAAEQVCSRIGRGGTPLPPRLAATAEVFTAGQIGLHPTA